MRRIITLSIIALVIAGGIRLATYAGNGSIDPEDKNQVLSNAVMTTLDGTEVTLQDYTGKTVLIDIWETWCTPCLRSMPTLQQLVEDFPDDFVVLAVSPGYMDSPEQIREFIDNHDYDFEFLFGEDLARDLNVQSIPFKVYVDPEGQYIESVMGTQGPEQDYEKTRKIIQQNM
ncbi:MAG: TlpA disulfide reductase family protein [Cyclonatronaceae bacterium]